MGEMVEERKLVVKWTRCSREDHWPSLFASAEGFHQAQLLQKDFDSIYRPAGVCLFGEAVENPGNMVRC